MGDLTGSLSTWKADDPLSAKRLNEWQSQTVTSVTVAQGSGLTCIRNGGNVVIGLVRDQFALPAGSDAGSGVPVTVHSTASGAARYWGTTGGTSTTAEFDSTDNGYAIPDTDSANPLTVDCMVINLDELTADGTGSVAATGHALTAGNAPPTAVTLCQIGVTPGTDVYPGVPVYLIGHVQGRC